MIESIPGIVADRVNGAAIDTNLRIKAIEVISTEAADATTRLATQEDVTAGDATNVGDEIVVPAVAQAVKVISGLSISP